MLRGYGARRCEAEETTGHEKWRYGTLEDSHHFPVLNRLPFATMPIANYLREHYEAGGSGTKESEARGCFGGIFILAGRIGRGRLPVIGSIETMRQRTPSGRL